MEFAFLLSVSELPLDLVTLHLVLRCITLQRLPLYCSSTAQFHHGTKLHCIVSKPSMSLRHVTSRRVDLCISWSLSVPGFIF